jgi:hypothetical protein
VHQPVPRYADELARRVSRVLDRLVAGRPIWRRNWTVHAHPDLHVPRPVKRPAPAVPGAYWLRSERQVLAALPATGGILFTIGTQQVPLATVAGQPEVATRLAEALESAPADLAAYRSGDADLAAIALWLRANAR